MRIVSRIGRVVKRSPVLYGLYLVLSRMYRPFRYAVQHVLEVGFDFQARSWASRDLRAIEAQWEQRNETKRIPFTSRIFSAYRPVSILEVGCNCGNNLYGLSHSFPGARLVGIDINGLAIEKGNEWLRQEKKDNITLHHCRAEELDKVITEQFDIVFSWASLIYIKPAMIEAVLGKMFEKAVNAVFLFEMQADKEIRTRKRLGVYCRGNWKRDYPSILREMGIVAKSTRVEWISPGIWLPGGGGAAVIELRKREP
jgi:SAM-dependent methyltransferase